MKKQSKNQKMAEKNKNIENLLRELKKDEYYIKPPNEETIRAEIIELLHCNKKMFHGEYNVYNIAGSLVKHITELIKEGVDPESFDFYWNIGGYIKAADNDIETLNSKNPLAREDAKKRIKEKDYLAFRIQDIIITGSLYNENSYKRMIKRGAEEGVANYGLAICYLDQNKDEQARFHLKIAADLGHSEAKRRLFLLEDKEFEKRFEERFGQSFRENFEMNLKQNFERNYRENMRISSEADFEINFIEYFESTFNVKFQLAFMGHMECDAKNYEMGIPKLERALEMDPEYEAAKEWLKDGKVQKLIDKGYTEEDPEKKIAIYQEAKTIDPKNKVVRNNLGEAYFILGNSKYGDDQERCYKEAGEELDAAIEIDSGYALAYSNLGQLYHMLGKRVQAKDYYKNAIRYDPSFEKPQKRLVELLKQTDEDFKRNPPNVFSPSTRGKNMFKEDVHEFAVHMRETKKYAAAVALSKVIIQADPEHVESYVSLGMSYRDTSTKGLAVKYFSKAVELNPNHKFANEQLKILTEGK